MKSIFKNNQFLKDLQNRLLVDVQDKYNNKVICESDVWRELQIHSSEYFRIELKQHISSFYAGRNSKGALADFSFDVNHNNKHIVNVKTYHSNPSGVRCCSVKKLFKGDAKDGFDGLENPNHYYLIVSFDYDIISLGKGQVKPNFYACHIFPICSYVATLKQRGKVGAAGSLAVSRNSLGQLNYLHNRLGEDDCLSEDVSRQDWIDMVKVRVAKDFDSQIALLEKERDNLC